MRFPSAKDIRAAIKHWEDKRWEFKEGRAVGDPEKIEGKELEERDWEICRDIASFANTWGGYIVIGVEDVRRGGRILGYRMGDRVKARMGNIVRARINPRVVYDVEAVKIQKTHVTVIAIDEGEGDICTVEGRVYIRGIAGKEMATGAEITRIVKRRQGKKYGPSPTGRELDTSEYNLATRDQREKALVGDFKAIGEKHGMKVVGELRHSNSIVVKMKCGRRAWHFLVWPIIGNVGRGEIQHLRGRVRSGVDGSDVRVLAQRDKVKVFPLVLAVGKVTSSASDGDWGHMFIPTVFGGYLGSGRRTEKEYEIEELRSHKFFLSGITGKVVMQERIEAFEDWLKEKGEELEFVKPVDD